MDNIYKELFQNNHIDKKQYELLDAIRSNKLVSLYYELRLTLYLGIMLFTGGVGYFAYQNIGEIGHLISMVLIGTSIIVGFYFIQKIANPYSNLEVTATKPYFDYLLLLVSLLIISLLAYIQVYFDLLALLVNWSSFISTAIFMFMAYRYDNRALLAMGITTLAAAIGISVSPINWVKGEWLSSNNLYVIGIFFGAFLVAIGQLSQYKNIKAHFKFTYQNFGLLLYYIGCISALFDSHHHYLYMSLLIASAGALSYYTWKTKEFLFFLYSNISFYIAFTYLVFSILDNFRGAEILLIYYFPVTCIAYIVILITKKNHFSND
ncbi:MAG: hypothetical protein J5I47_12070 [Vicingus serpentipes]|nr:hypothetical protein [Vicingus serpentipes]